MSTTMNTCAKYDARDIKFIFLTFPFLGYFDVV